ncbi:MAG TPA: histidine phosphatase family protein [Alphaproteobacteria bacterium]|nr:histidine phosphatase family protein [Alphaproteobacteria bacterium]
MILVRHGQSYFNLHYGATGVDPGIEDPRLTEAGRQQAKAVATALARRAVKRLIVSPYTRTLETAEIIAEAMSLPMVIEPLVRERAAFACDIGTSPRLLAERWPHLSFDHLEERWWGAGVERDAALATRCQRFRAAMSTMPDWRNVAVISHWGFIRGLTGQAIANGAHIEFDPTEGFRP